MRRERDKSWDTTTIIFMFKDISLFIFIVLANYLYMLIQFHISPHNSVYTGSFPTSSHTVNCPYTITLSGRWQLQLSGISMNLCFFVRFTGRMSSIFRFFAFCLAKFFFSLRFAESSGLDIN